MKKRNLFRADFPPLVASAVGWWSMTTAISILTPTRKRMPTTWRLQMTIYANSPSNLHLDDLLHWKSIDKFPDSKKKRINESKWKRFWILLIGEIVDGVSDWLPILTNHHIESRSISNINFKILFCCFAVGRRCAWPIDCSYFRFAVYVTTWIDSRWSFNPFYVWRCSASFPLGMPYNCLTRCTALWLLCEIFSIAACQSAT